MVQPAMNVTLGKILLVGLPLVASLSWFVFWVVKLMRLAKKLKGQARRSANGRAESGPPRNSP